MLCKKLWRAIGLGGSFFGGSSAMSKSIGGGDREVLIYLLIYSIKSAYLQLMTVLVYRSSPLKS